VKVRYLHSDIDTLERIQILRDLRRESSTSGRHQPAARGARPAGSVAGRDSRRRQGRVPALGGSLIQTVGPRRAQRHGRRIMYADSMTDSMRLAIARPIAAARSRQAYNEEHGITPQSIVKSIDEVMSERLRARLRDGRPRRTSRTFRTQASSTPTSPAAGR
jgi:excinuclease ABC subunit B